MRVFLAEKPSLGRAIAAALDGQRQEFDGFIRVGPHDVVTWNFGHLLELAEPGYYDARWKKWSLTDLPIKVGADQWHLIPRDDAKKQLGVIRGLLSKAKLVVNAGDPDREGQMLVDEVLDYFRWSGETQRILIFDPTPAGVRKALAGMRPNREYRNLFDAAKCRSRADWLVGMNLTRAASTRIGLTASIGRVQTPTLALIVRRDREVGNHKASFFYTLDAHVSTASDSVVLTHSSDKARILDKAVADGIAKRLNGGMVELRVTETPFKEHAPLPHTLTSFHKAGEARYGWSAQKALNVLQALYEKALTTYPRTGCPYLPKAHAGRAVPIATAILDAGHAPAVNPLRDRMAPSPRVYDDSKVEEHHGIIPTGKLPGASLSADELAGWKMVAERFLMTLLPAYEAIKKEASFTFEEREFKTAGELPINASASWRVLEPKLGVDKQPIRPLQLSLNHGETGRGRVGPVEVKQGKTTPPKPYTESSLVEDLKSIHKFIEDPRIKAALKETAGIGTEATHASIIETLKLRRYVHEERTGRSKKSYLRSTTFGQYVIDNMPKALADPGVTAVWEQELDQIAKGLAQPAVFMEKIERYVGKQLERISASSFPEPPELPKAPVKKSAKRKPQKRKVV